MNPSASLRATLLCLLIGLAGGAWFSLLFSALWLLVSAIFFAFNLNFKIALWMFCSGCGLVYSAAYETIFYQERLDPLTGHALTFKGVVTTDPQLNRAGHPTLQIELLEYRADAQQWYPLNGKVLWQTREGHFGKGDELTLQGTITKIGKKSETFDAAAYWERWGVRHAVVRGSVLEQVVPSSEPYNLWLRSAAVEQLEHHLDKPYSTIALGMLIGLKDKLPSRLEQNFKDSGLQHLLVVSGTNVTLLLILLGVLLRGATPLLRYALGVPVLLAYLYLVGTDPPALRATILGLLVGAAVAQGFEVDYRNLLLLCALMMGLYDPRYLTFDVSFALSFAATAGIIFAVPVLNVWLGWIKFKTLRLLLAASISAQGFVFPILITKFGSFPYAGLFTNLLSEPLVPLIMALAFSVLLLSWGPFSLITDLASELLEAALVALVALARVGASLPPLEIPNWGGYLLFAACLGLMFWASFSPFYQTRYWHQLQKELSA